MALMSLVCSGCNKPVETDTEQPAPFVSTLPMSTCGLPETTWQSDERMGEIIAFEYLESSSLSAQMLTGLMDQFELEVFSPVPYGIQVYRIRYITQNHGEQIEATGLVAFPDVAEPQTFPTLLWVRPTVGFSDDCAPSGKPAPEPLAHTLLAGFGYTVVAPDLLGMNGWGEPAGFVHPYITPEPTAIAALDSVRALWRFQGGEGQGGIHATPDSRAVFIGASEGGFGAIWADRYANGYAPEIDVVGVVAAVPPTNLTGLAKGAIEAPNDATGGLAAVLASSNTWYGGTGDLNDVFTDSDPTFLASSIENALLTSCSGGDNPLDDTSTVEDVYQQPFIDAVLAEDWDAIEPWGCYLQTGDLAHSAVARGTDTPVLYQVGELDNLVLGYVGRADAERLCDNGYSQLEYLECAGSDHVTGAAQSLPYQLDWLQSRLAGEALTETCVIGAPVDCSIFGLDL